LPATGLTPFGSPFGAGPCVLHLAAIESLLSDVTGTIRDMDSQQRVGDDERRIAAAFNDYFANFGIGIAPDEVIVGSRRTIRDGSGWAITYRVDRDASGAPSLEFYATHRRTNDRHVLISADGELEHLEALSDWVIVDSDNSDVQNGNDAIERRLEARGIYPHGPG